MKILIGTPICDKKAYSIPWWLECVQNTPGEWTLLMVDNSDFDDFSNDLRPLVQEAFGPEHPVSTVWIPECRGLGSEYRLVRAREYIRLRFLEGDYDAWMSWECDIMAPPHGLQTLVDTMEHHQAMAVTSSYPDRKNPSIAMNGLGFALFKRPILERFSFLEGGGTAFCNPDLKQCFYSGDGWLWYRVFRAGMRTIDLHNMLPLEHLDRETYPAIRQEKA